MPDPDGERAAVTTSSPLKGRGRRTRPTRVGPLVGDAVELLPEACRGCLFWELGSARPDPRASGDSRAEAVTRKEAWCATQTLEGTPPGRMVWIDGAPAGYVLFGPSGSFTTRRPLLPTVSEDALLLATLWVEPHRRDRGLGRLLVQASVRAAVDLDLGAVEAYGDRRFRERDCLLPATWLLHEGFVVHREHSRYPLLRLDVRRTVRWAESLEHALEELLGHVPSRAPVPGRVLPGGASVPSASGA